MTTKLKLTQLSPPPPSESEVNTALENKVDTSTYATELNSLQNRLNTLENLNISSRLNTLESINALSRLTLLESFCGKLYKNLGSNYVMSYTDFDKIGALYAISSLDTSDTKNYPAQHNDGDYSLIRLYAGSNNFLVLLGISPRSSVLYLAKFWDGAFNGWCTFNPDSNSIT